MSSRYRFERRISWILAALLGVLLVGCDDGGGGDSIGSPDAVVLEGIFTDAAVEGLSYRTATRSGVTDSAGTFQYLAGETVTFSVGGTVFGDAVAAKGTMTPLDLVPGATLPVTNLDLQYTFERNPQSPANLAFRRFANILAFLQTLDQDADADNGITIPPAVATLLDDIEVDLDADLDEFRDQKLLRIRLHRAVDQELMSTAAIRRPGPALDHFYATQEIETSFSVWRVSSWDRENDGVTDSIVTQNFDAAGYPSTRSEDGDADGVPHASWVWVHDRHGNELSKTLDWNADGTADQEYLSIYDVNGKQLSWRIDNDGDRVVDQITLWEYDDDGNLTALGGDHDDDGEMDYATLRSYDGNGNELTQETFFDFDLPPWRIASFSYDANNNMTSQSTDDDADGVLDEIKNFEHDADGRVVVEINDWNADGVLDSREAFAYDDKGNLISLLSDWNMDGETDSAEYFEYDANGNQTLEGYDDDLDDVLDDESVTWFYDESGHRIREEEAAGDGAIASVTTWTYDEFGNRIEQQDDWDADGTPETLSHWTYTDTGVLISTIRERPVDESPDTFVTYINGPATWTTMLNELGVDRF